MFTRPEDLPDSMIADALERLWGFRAASLAYQAVGFGSHHWMAIGTAGDRLFVTVNDLVAKLRTARDTADAAFGRLAAAIATASALRADAGLSFVVAPLRAVGGQIVARLCDRYCLVVHPYVAGEPAGEDGEFASDEDRLAVLDMLVKIHGARAGDPRVDDFDVPHLDALQTIIEGAGTDWGPGPYAVAARELLDVHVRDVSTLVQAYRGLASRVAARQERMVITHGEPHASNVMTTSRGLVLVDWDTALLAPPERDLWHLADDDPSVLQRYTAATGTAIDSQALTLYRLWWDLAEIGEYLGLFRSAHADTADTRESWKNLQQFLRPAERWPGLILAEPRQTGARSVESSSQSMAPSAARPPQGGVTGHDRRVGRADP
ncbi:MAG TPA: phosphotransferase [Streptosporangiaceae bacterium]|nr:phosphotransferase [Streptosporangiaceae bacterium]